MDKPISTKDIFWKSALYTCVCLALAVLLAVFLSATGHTQELKHHTGPPVKQPSCAQRLDQVRFREWTAAKAEGLLHVRVGEHTDAVWYYRQAQYLLTDKNLTPSPAHCTEKWLDTSEAQVLLLEQVYRDDVDYFKAKGLLK